MTAYVLFVSFFLFIVSGFFNIYINIYIYTCAEFLGDQPVGQLCRLVMRTSAEEQNVFMLDIRFQRCVKA